jgi:maltose 6'-phosphate phosphatase
MRVHRSTFGYSILLAFIFILLPLNVSAWLWNSGPQCDDVAERGHINILTFNILFFAPQISVESRLVPIVDFLENQDIIGEPVDLVFLQEVVGGKLALSDFTNSARILKELLLERGLEYNLRTAFEIGVPGVFYTGNATLSRCKIKFSIVKRLPRESEIEILGQVIKLPRNVQMTRIKIPDFGKFSAYNTHLCAGCSADDRGEQLNVLLDFVDTVENFIPGGNPILLAGDFNIDLFKDKGPGETFGPDKDLYDAIIANGFVDAYAGVFGGPNALSDLCPDEDDGDVHCTVGTTAFDLFDPSNASRIDYIFGKGFGPATAAEVFFNPVVDDTEPTVPISDHSAALVRIPLY